MQIIIISYQASFLIFQNKILTAYILRLYDMFVKEYNDKREHGGINDPIPKPTPSKKVSPMWVFENDTYLCKMESLFTYS
jgi:hypothetical protein